MPVKTITAEIDGQVRKITANIPDDATQDELMEAVRSYQSTSPQPRQITQGDREKAGYGFLPQGSFFQKGIDYLRGMDKSPHEQSNVNIFDRAIEFARPLENIPALAAGKAAAQSVPPQFSLPAGLAVGGATYLGLDRLLQGLSSEKPTSFLANTFGAEPDSELATNLNSLENILLAEGGAKVTQKAMSGIRSAWHEVIKPGSRVDPIIFKLKGTYGQYTGKKLPKLIEDIFATKSKQLAQEKSAELGMKEGVKIASDLSGRKPGAVANLEEMGKNIALSGEEARRALLVESSNQAEIAKRIAGQNQVTISRPNSVPGSLTMPPNPIRTWTVNGPINANKTLQEAQSYLLEKQKLFGDLSGLLEGVPKEDVKLVRAAMNLLRVGNVPIVSAPNPLTGIMEHTYDLSKAAPISFEDAWNWKKEFGGLFAKNKKATTFFKSLNDDMESSIQSWSTGSKTALDAWKRAKSVVEFRRVVYEEKGLDELVDNFMITDSNPIVDSIISDSTKLQRALVQSKFKIPGETQWVASRRGDFQAYKLMDWLNDAYRMDSADPTKIIFNPEKLTKDFSDAKMVNQLKLLFNQPTRERIQELFRGLATTQQKMMIPGPYIKYMWPVRGGISLAAGIATGNLSGSAAFGAGVTGLVLMGSAVGKLMTNPNTARIMAAMARGEKLGSDAYLSRVITGVLRGSGAAVGLEHKDGTVTYGSIDNENKFIEKEED